MKSGFVALLGRPNVGKSTLLNAILKKKVCIVTDKPQTTRNTIRGIYREQGIEIVFVDTPGIHKPHAKLGEEMNKMAYSAAHDVDIFVLVVDASLEFSSGDDFLLKHLDLANKPLVIVFNKIDLAKIDKTQLLMEKYRVLFPNAEIVETVANDQFNVETLIKKIVEKLPEGPAYYPEETIIDKDEIFQIKEIIRESILKVLREEVPHSVAIVVDNAEWGKDPLTIHSTIIVEKDSQKGIVIGEHGRRIKMIGSKARLSLEKYFNKHVFLELFVKVEEDWRNNENLLLAYGYKQKNK